MSNILLDKPDLESHFKALGFDRVLAYKTLVLPQWIGYWSG